MSIYVTADFKLAIKLENAIENASFLLKLLNRINRASYNFCVENIIACRIGTNLKGEQKGHEGGNMNYRQIVKYCFRCFSF